MKTTISSGFAVAAALAGTFGLGSAQAQDLSARSERYVESHVVAADGTERMQVSYTERVLKSDVLDQFKSQSVSYSASAQALEITEAYTLKANGKHVAVPKANYQVHTAGGNSGAAAVFSDRNSTTIVFPDLAVGDAVVLSYRLVTRQPLFPGKLSFYAAYPLSVPYDDVHVSFDLPATMPVIFKNRRMQEQVSVKGGRRLIDWRLQNKTPVRGERSDYSVYDADAEPGYALSTFADYAEIAHRYLERAAPKAKVTPRIQTLADQITAGKDKADEQAKALYAWVATNITYGGNCVGIGAVVPRDSDFVLDNRMGDCKDHATLLQALLAAKGIPARQVLVNAGNGYELGEIPVASQVNHVINYLPSLHLFLDSTDDGTPFGELPMADRDKPVLSDAADTPPRTPADPSQSSQVLKAKLEVLEDGSVDGEVEVQVDGFHGNANRRSFKGLSSDDAKLLVKRILASMRLEGEGTVEFSDTQEVVSHFSVKSRFHVSKAFRVTGSGALPIGIPLFNFMPVAAFAQAAQTEVEDHETVCFNGSTQESYEITLPEKLKVLSVPDGTAFSAHLLDYESKYLLEGRVLRASRSLHEHLERHGIRCSADMNRQYKTEMAPVFEDVRQVLLYK